MAETAFYITIYVAPENVEKFLEESKAVFEKIKAEPGLVFFEMYQTAGEPGTISWVEKWYVSIGSPNVRYIMGFHADRNDQTILLIVTVPQPQNQMTKPYYPEYFAVTEPMYVKPREMKVLSPLGSPFFFQKS
ncbi:C6 finger domain-containing protein [Colletotrichum plurivorum]|uniref:C6 finger domain-containing protein n=1 Tax=Colletotrichum plurivorum TaxID=2175906 RepID=A0A8H6NAM8_9PEZI|nr:C6 finger domain-containing protein [Colletotrichum plurivorum]